MAARTHTTPYKTIKIPTSLVCKAIKRFQESLMSGGQWRSATVEGRKQKGREGNCRGVTGKGDSEGKGRQDRLKAGSKVWWDLLLVLTGNSLE